MNFKLQPVCVVLSFILFSRVSSANGPKDDTYVCLFDVECFINLKAAFKPEQIFVGVGKDCTKEMLLELNTFSKNLTVAKVVTENVEVPFLRWTPDRANISESDITLCSTTEEADTNLVGSVTLLDLTSDYSLDDNNFMRFDILDSKRDVKLVVSRSELPALDENNTYVFTQLGKHLVAYAPLNAVISKTEDRQFYDVYAHLHFHTIASNPTFIRKITIFDGSGVEFEHRVVEGRIVAELRGIHFKHIVEQSPVGVERQIIETFGLTAQSSETTQGLESRCGDRDALWKVPTLPFKTHDDNSLTLLLPLELYGKGIRICGGRKWVDKIENKIPIQTFVANYLHGKYFNKLFYTNAIGLTEITLDNDMHPLSEIRLVHVCDMADDDPIRKTTAKANIGCKKPEMHTLGYLQIKDELERNFAYRPEDLFLSLYNKDMLNEYFVPHKLYFLPDSSSLLEFGSTWTKKRMFLPRLFAESTFPYVIKACDRWKHPLCLRDEDYDTTLGAIYPPKQFAFSVTAKWDQEVLELKVQTASWDDIVVKLVESDDLQYADYQAKCNSYKGIFPARADKVQKQKRLNQTFYFNGVTPGHVYYLCTMNMEQEPYEAELDDFYTIQRMVMKNPFNDYIKNQISWDFWGIVNTQSPMVGQRFTFKRAGENAEFLFPTTGFDREAQLAGYYFTDDLSFDCTALKPRHALTLKTRSDSHSVLIYYAQEKYTKANAPTQNETGQGFWVKQADGNWSTLRKYIKYSGPFEGDENLYKVCTCTPEHCFFSGNAATSRMDTFELTQFIRMNDFYDRLVLGSQLCLYNKRKLTCFDGTDDFKRAVAMETQFSIPPVEILNVSFDHAARLILVLTPRRLLVYQPDLAHSIKITRFPRAKRLYSFPGVTFVLLPGSMAALTGTSSVDQFVAAHATGTGFNGQEVQFPKDPRTVNLNLPISPNAGEPEILRFDENTFWVFHIDERLALRYRTVEFNKELDRATVTDKLRVELTEHFPGVTEGLFFKFVKTSLCGTDMLVFFVGHYDFDEIGLFYLKEGEITFYAHVRVQKGILDFITTASHIICLNARIAADAISEHIFQLEYRNLVEAKLEYPTLGELIRGKECSFAPELSGGLVLGYSASPVGTDSTTETRERIGTTGLFIDRKSGVISGVPTFVGKLEAKVYVEVFMGSGSARLAMLSRCPLGHQMNAQRTDCETCPQGYYRHKVTLDRCLSCNDYITHSTTKGRGATSALECLCAPGYFHANHVCQPCPAGRYSDKPGAMACDGRCPENETSDKTGAKSLADLECTCAPGSYRMGTKCKPCEAGTYCPVGDMVIECPPNMTSLETGHTSKEGCMCAAGHELVDGECRPCDIDKFKPTVGNGFCTPCPSDESGDVRSYTSGPGSTSKADCNHCPPGFHFDGGSCAHCPPGFFCRGGNTPAIHCGPNTIIKSNAVDSSCCLCRRGYGASRLALNADVPMTCQKCPRGTFQNIDGTRGACIVCPQNTYTLDEGSTSLSDCIPRPGYYSVTHTNYKIDLAEMEARAQGRGEVDMGVLDIICYNSPEIRAGYNAVLADSLEACIALCKHNRFCKYVFYQPLLRDGATACQRQRNYCAMYTTFDLKIAELDETAIVADRNAHQGHILCKLDRKYLCPKFMRCPRNHFCPGGLEAAKIRCPLHSVTLHSGESEPEACLCLPGYHQFDKFCVPCERGHYKPAISNAACTPCPENMTTTHKGAFHVRQCTCAPNMYAVAKLVPQTVPTKRVIYLGNHEEPAGAQGPDLDVLLRREIRALADATLDVACELCPSGYFCKGGWLFNRVHMPPIPCYNGSSVPPSRRSHSSGACLCNPGYGLVPFDPSIDPGYGVACDECLPGTYKGVFANEPCHGRCPPNSTSLPGAVSEADCFCLPGFYMATERGKAFCKRCERGLLCPGGVKKGVHARPVPKTGYAIVDASEHLGRAASFLEAVALHAQNRRNAPQLTLPCLSPERCLLGGSCSPGSGGFLCSECLEGHDTHHFASTCSACSRELLKLLGARVLMYALLVLVCAYNNSANRRSEFSLVAILKILYVFVLSLVPLGIIPTTSRSTLRNFRNLYERFFYYPLNFYAFPDRVNCFRPFVLGLVRLLSKLGIGPKIAEVSQLQYLHVWYAQRYFAVLKLPVDLGVIAALHALWQLLRRYIPDRTTVRRNLKAFSANLDACECSLAAVHSENDVTDTGRPAGGTLKQHLLVALCLHAPSILLNALSMLWCTRLGASGSHVLFHMPTQMCSFRSGAFTAGAVVAAALILCIAAFLITLRLLLGTQEYTTGWRNIFITGYKVKYRFWDVVHMLRQLLTVALIVFQTSNDAKDLEVHRLLYYVLIQIAYLVLVQSCEPYDSRSGFAFLGLEKYTTLSCIFLALFMYGAHFYNYLYIGGVPFLVAVLAYKNIIFALVRELVSICSLADWKFARTFTSSFPTVFKYDNSAIYFNYNDDTVVFESYNVRKKPKARKFTIHGDYKDDKGFFIALFQDLMRHSVLYKNRAIFSNDFCSFYVRLVFWHSHCLRMDFKKVDADSDEFKHVVAYLYYFDPSYRNDVVSILFNYPFNEIASHRSYYHGSSQCGGGCNSFHLKPPDECIDEVAACLLVDLLFGGFYDDMPLTLTGFYYSMLSVSRLSESSLKRIFQFSEKHTKYVRNPQDFTTAHSIKELGSKITTLRELARKQGELGALKIEQHELTLERDQLKEEISKLSEAIEQKNKSVTVAHEQLSRVSALKVGVEDEIIGPLTNEEIANSISVIYDDAGDGKSRRSQRRRRISEPNFKMNVP